MKLPKKQAAVVRAALEEWRASGLLDEEIGKRLLDDLTPLPFDWYRLGRYALWSALTCILIGVAALLGDELFLELISRLFVMTELGRSLFLILAAAGLFFWGVRRRRRAPQKRLTNEGLFFLGVLAIAGSLASLAAWLYAYGGEDIGFLNISSLFLLAAVIYGALGLLLDSRLIWVFALFAFGSWLGAETGYRSGWGAYYLGMNYTPCVLCCSACSCAGSRSSSNAMTSGAGWRPSSAARSRWACSICSSACGYFPSSAITAT